MKQLFLVLSCLLILYSLFAVTVAMAEYTQERVVSLPQDQGKWYVSIFGDTADLQFQRLQAWFQNDPGLSNIREQVHFNVYPTTSAHYQRYARTLPGYVCVRVQNSKGSVLSEYWDEYLPSSGDLLYQGIALDIQKKTGFAIIHRLRDHCPGPNPNPNPVPVPVPALVEPMDDPPVLDAKPEEPVFPWMIAVLAAALGVGLGVSQGYKKEHIDALSPTKAL